MSFTGRYDGYMRDTMLVTVTKTEEAGRRCGIWFNPNQDERVEKIKGFMACAMQAVIEARDAIEEDRKSAIDWTSQGPNADREAMMDMYRCMEIALTHLETAQMFAVKGLFHSRE